MTTFSNRLAALSPEKRALLARRMRQQSEEQARPPIVPIPRVGETFALSFTQERLWFLDQLAPGSPIYNLPTALRYVGQLDYAALGAALSVIVERHEALRTTFEGGASTPPVQRIRPAQPVAMPMVDLSELPEAQREAEAQRLAFEEAQLPFDLSSDQLLRVRLLRLSEHEHIHLITMHHIVADGWSSGVFVRELAALYSAFCQHRERHNALAAAQLAPLPIQYVDYAAWQRQWLRGAVIDRELAYWREQLDGAPALLELPTDRPRPAIQSTNGTTMTRRIPAELTAQLHALAKQEGATLFMTLLAGFNALLYRYTRQTDILIGSPIAGRSQAETHGLIGFFVNMLVLRAQLNGATPARELLQQVRSTALGAYAHQEIPFEMLVEDLRPERSLSYTPLFQVAFALQNAPMEPLKLTDLTVHPPAEKSGVAKYDLCFELTEVDGGIDAMMEYNTDLFDTPTIARMLEHYQNLLAGFVTNLDQPLSALPLLSQAEQEQLLVAFNTTPGTPNLSQSMIAIFEDWAVRQPHAIAAQCDGEQRSYGELNTRANQRAHWLAAQGIGHGDRIGLFGERGLAMLECILAAYKLGAAYVPLDPAHPDARLATIIEAAELAAIACDSSQVPRTGALATQHGGSPLVFCWDAADTLDQQPCQNLPAVSQPHDLANIFFTSGSTGTPKGVMVEQIGMLNHLWAKIGVVELGPDDVVAQNASHCFDISTWQFLAPLVAGGRVAIYSNDTALDPAALLAALERDGISVLETVPTMLEAMLRVCDEGTDPFALPALHYLISNAETLPVPLANRWLERFPTTPLLNTYGATECSDDTTHYVLRAPLPANTPRVPVGQSIGGMRMYVLDEQLAPVPIGVPGQIAMAGIGVGRGYLGDSEKTALAFVPDPFATRGRLYLSGDLGRWNADGQLEFLGRLDHQVKIRGHRIELGEVEAALARLPGVRQALATTLPDERGQLRLVAYLAADAPIAFGTLREFLRTLLPPYMLPDAAITLDAFPVNRNGKIDRARLPIPDQSLNDGAELVAPRTPVEELLGGIWSDILQREQIGVDQNFFELGGHSLLATQVISRARAAFGLDLPLRTLFETPTIAGLAATIERQQRDATFYAPITPAQRNGLLPASFAQQRLWFLDQLETGSPVYNMPTALRLHGLLDHTALERALSEIVSAHEVLRTTFVGVDGQPFQYINPPKPVSIPLIELAAGPREAQEAEAVRLLTRAVKQPFDLTHGPLLRSVLLRFSAEEHLLLIVIHHIATDGWSTSVLLDELAKRYPTAHPNEAPSIQYADFAAWQRATFTDDALAQHRTYWSKQLADADTVLNMPTDRPRPPVQTFNGALATATIGAELAQGLQALSRREGATLFMTLLAGLQIVIQRYTGQSDFLIGTPIASRTRSELEPLIGFFVNTLVLRAALGDQPNTHEIIRRAREAALDAYAHQDMPFEMLVELIQPERSLSHSPLFQVLFVLNNTPALPAAFGDLQVTALANEGAVAKYDLTLAVAETAAGLELTLEYNTDLFDAATAHRMLGHYQTVLQGMVANPTQSVATLPLLTKPEQHLLQSFNATAAPYSEACLHQLFETWAERTPSAIAVTADDGQISYGELNQRANQLAHYLRAQGVGPETPIGLCVDRSINLVVCLLGIFKAGGAYLPLDPTYPADRLAFMLQDAQVPLLITQKTLVDQLPAISGTVIRIDTDWPQIATQPNDNPVMRGDNSRLAYLIYTSGSTGVPKGVQIIQRAAVNILEDMHQRLDFGPRDTLLSITSLSFDISVIDFFMPLCSGAQLVVASRAVAADGFRLLELITNSGATVMQGTPSAWRMLLQAGWPPLSTLRIGITGGEALSRDLAEQLIPRMGQLWNFYGPTETTIWSTCQMITSAEQAVLIGKPVANTQVYVLDGARQQAPIGVPGELYIGGDGMARGYLHRPELNAERFISWQAGNTETRLYRTGDIVRFLPDGTLEYFGRIDHQVKIRGYRIELGEIETALRCHPALRDVAVVAREDTPGNKRLIAYLVGDALPSIADLRSFLQGLLPTYMVPDAFMMLAALPQTPNGKLDRKALPAPDQSRPALGQEYRAPRTTIEIEIAAIWSNVLEVAQVGIDDNFFALGGHSIRATQLIARINEAFAVDIPLRQLFEEPTVAALASYIENNHGDVLDMTIDEDELVALLDTLSEAEVEALLAKKLQSLA